MIILLILLKYRDRYYDYHVGIAVHIFIVMIIIDTLALTSSLLNYYSCHYYY